MEGLQMIIGLVIMALNILYDMDSCGGYGRRGTSRPCINPASGWPMISDDCSGVDVIGNPYGRDDG
jgi:hypothetical protein